MVDQFFKIAAHHAEYINITRSVMIETVFSKWHTNSKECLVTEGTTNNFTSFR